MSDWQPIETAPRGPNLGWLHLPKNPKGSGPVIFSTVEFHPPESNDALGVWAEGCWWANGRYYAPGSDRGYFTHWMPLPDPPQV